MRWKAHFFLKGNKNEEENNGETEDQNEYYGLKSKRTPPQIDDMANFERDLLSIVDNLQFRQVQNNFQRKLSDDTKKLNASDKIFVHAEQNKKHISNEIRRI